MKRWKRGEVGESGVDRARGKRVVVRCRGEMMREGALCGKGGWIGREDE